MTEKGVKMLKKTISTRKWHGSIVSLVEIRNIKLQMNVCYSFILSFDTTTGQLVSIKDHNIKIRNTTKKIHLNLPNFFPRASTSFNGLTPGDRMKKIGVEGPAYKFNYPTVTTLMTDILGYLLTESHIFTYN